MTKYLQLRLWWVVLAGLRVAVTLLHDIAKRDRDFEREPGHMVVWDRRCRQVLQEVEAEYRAAHSRSMWGD